MQSVVRSFLGVLLLTVVFGFVFPTRHDRDRPVAFAEQVADGSLVEVDGQVVGSKLAAQAFTEPQYFHPRPSAVDYNAAGTSFSNLGPTNPELAKAVRIAARQAILDARRAVQPRADRRRHSRSTRSRPRRRASTPTSRPRTPSCRPPASRRSAT